MAGPTDPKDEQGTTRSSRPLALASRPSREVNSPNRFASGDLQDTPLDTLTSPGGPDWVRGTTDPTQLRTAASETVLADAIRSEEALRARGFTAIAATGTLAIGFMVPWLDGHGMARITCFLALITMGVTSLLVSAAARDPRRYTVRLQRGYATLLSVCALALEYYIGYFSAVPVALTLGIYFIAQARDRVSATWVPRFTIVMYAGPAMAIALGYMPDQSLFPADGANLATKVFAVGAVSLVLILTQRMARISRESFQSAMRRSHQALLVVAEREAQLQEARQNLDLALRAAVGKPGRYTGLFAGEFELEEVIGLGAMGEVYAARRLRDSLRAAVKLMQPDALLRDDLVERFLREGEISGGLNSPHVVQVFGVGRMNDGAPYLAMEHLTGEDLAAQLRREGHLGLRDAVRMLDQVAHGLKHAHGAGIVHRDLKPHNLYLARTEQDGSRWKILDFGVSKLSNSDGTLTAHHIVGTPSYMAPEQARGQNVDLRSDIFSMGVLLYRALTGRQPFGAKSTPEVMFEIVYRTPERPSALRPGLPSDVDLVLAMAMAKAPEARFQSASELARALRAAAERKLPQELRERGRAVVARYPWNSTLSPPENKLGATRSHGPR